MFRQAAHRQQWALRVPLSTGQWQPLLRDVLILLGQEQSSLLPGLTLSPCLILGVTSSRKSSQIDTSFVPGLQHALHLVFSSMALSTDYNVYSCDSLVNVSSLLVEDPWAQGPHQVCSRRYPKCSIGIIGWLVGWLDRWADR